MFLSETDFLIVAEVFVYADPCGCVSARVCLRTIILFRLRLGVIYRAIMRVCVCARGLLCIIVTMYIRLFVLWRWTGFEHVHLLNISNF